MTLELLGCTHDSLGSYLKSLAVLRLISQRDPQARGRWGSVCFVLESVFDRQALINFFLTDYEPTPVLAPWNGGSGFYPNDRKDGLNAILNSNDKRFTTYRRDIQRAQVIVGSLGDNRIEAKRDLVRLCRNQLSDKCVEWIDAAIAIDSAEKLAFAPVLGTGGNEGRLDYTNNFMERLQDLLIAPVKKPPVQALLENALFGDGATGMQSIAVGQYDPGRAGGFNQGEKIEADSVANPWNIVLTTEGASAWVGGVYRKQGVAYRSILCSPFTVRPSAVGYGSASLEDQESTRAEIWAPIWSEAARWAELRALLREGRASVDGKPAVTGLDFAQAAAGLGVDRGIDSFVRFSLLKRRGDSYIALRSGLFKVEHRTAADLVGELTPLLHVAATAARGTSGQAPSTWPPLQRAVDEAIFQFLLYKDRSDLLIEVAAAFGAIHRWLLSRNKQVYWPSKLSKTWISELWSKPEARIAAAIAHMSSKDAGKFQDNVTPGSLRFCWTGRDLSARMLATLRRRTVDGARSEHSPFGSDLLAETNDAVNFLDGVVDERLIEDLIFAFLLCTVPDKTPRINAPLSNKGWLRWPAYSILKQIFSRQTHPLLEATSDEPRFRPDLAIASLLEGHQVDRAVDEAIRRLRIQGLRLTITKGWNGSHDMRLGAALLIPVRDVKSLRIAITKADKEIAV